MNLQWLFAFVASGTAIGALPLSSEPRPRTVAPHDPRVRVEIDARAPVPARYLAAAQREAARVLVPAMTVVWHPVPDAIPSVRVHLVSCKKPDPEAPPCRKGVVGSTVPTPDGSSRTVWIYMDRLKRHVTPGLRERNRLLGRVLAHEIVHAVVGRDAHEYDGLMRPFWTPEILWQADDEDIALSAALRERIRESIGTLPRAATPQVATRSKR